MFFYCSLDYFDEHIGHDIPKIIEKYDKETFDIHDTYIIIIPKSIHEDRIKANIDIFDFSLNEEEINALSKIDRNEPMIGKPEVPEFTETAMRWIK